MTFMQDVAIIFDKEFGIYERNRMLPPGCRKELTMKKMTRKHVSALSHSKLFLHKAFESAAEPRFKLEIEKDLELLDEVEQWILWAMYNPSLPLPIPENPKEEHDGI